MAKKGDKERLYEIAANTLSVSPKVLKDALDNALDISILKRDLQIATDMLNKERQEHENQVKLLRTVIEKERQRNRIFEKKN